MSPFVLIRVLQRHRTNEVFNFKKLVHMFVGARKSEIFRAGQQSGNSNKNRCCGLESEFHRAVQVDWKLEQGFFYAVVRRPNSFAFEKPQSLLLRSPTDDEVYL